MQADEEEELAGKGAEHRFLVMQGHVYHSFKNEQIEGVKACSSFNLFAWLLKSIKKSKLSF